MGLGTVLRNAKNRFVFADYGNHVYIAPDVSIKRPHLVTIGNHVTIQSHSFIYIHPSEKEAKRPLLQLGNYVHVGRNNTIAAVNSVILEDYVLLGPNVSIFDSVHNYEDTKIPIVLQGYSRGGSVHLEKECFIGANVFIFPNVTIGRHSVIGANSVVKQSIPPFSVAVGAPAKIVRRYDFEKKKWLKV